MKKMLEGLRVGFALTGSFCTFETAFGCVEELIACGATVIPIISHATATLDTRFGTAEETKNRLTRLTSHPPICTVAEAEPIGPGKLLDILLILPATGNTLAKLTAGIADTAVTMAAKSHLRNNRPLVLAVSSNDALAGGAKNIGHLLNTRNIYFVPFGQDDPAEKPRSMVFFSEKVVPAVEAAWYGKQLQPILGV
jgi:dipicolinate synthase subunit B